MMRNPTGATTVDGLISIAILGFVSIILAEGRLSAQDTEPTPPQAPLESAFQKDDTDRSVDRAIAFLIKNQKPDGAIYDKGHATTMTSLSIMAMAGVGIQPVDPTPEGRAMNKALAYVLHDDRVDDQGYFGRADGSRMYGHGITTLMLTEMKAWPQHLRPH